MKRAKGQNIILIIVSATLKGSMNKEDLIN